MNTMEERSSKRRRIDHSQHAPQNDIRNVDQLQQLLHFKQDNNAEVKRAVNQFKDFLTSINRTEDLAQRSRQSRVLRQYCEAQTAPTKDDLDFPDLISTWSFAATSNNDHICSAVPAALAQFYKTISGILEFREFGLSLGHTLLKRDQVRLFDRGLSASRTKEHLISPCLRLLTEIVSFDGGALAGRVFERRDVLFKRLDFLLDQQNVEGDTDRRKPSVRRMALRLLIANLKFMDTSAKIEFIQHGRILRNCLRGLLFDGDDIVVDVLKSIDVGLVEDKEIPRITKSRIFSQDSLTSLATLYNYESDEAYPDSATSVRNAIHEVLTKICTTRKGILLPQSGWYPVAFDSKADTVNDDNYVNLGLDSPLYTDEYTTNIPVKNMILSSFAQSLKPESDTLQSTLLLQIIRAAPELVADYFSKKPKFTAPSNDDVAWRSQFAFLFSISQLPIPKNFGWQEESPSHPPPISIVIESILPRPFDRTTLSKYFTSNEEILVLSTARLIVVALEKLQSVLRLFSKQASSTEWPQASSRLIEAILQRVPRLHEIVTSLQSIGKENQMVRLALFECLAVYHKVLPEATTGSKFDFGATLADSLSELQSQADDKNAEQLLNQQIPHLVTVAELSPATKWLTKADSEKTCLFTQLLRFAIPHAEDKGSSEILSVLASVATTAGFLSIAELSFSALQVSISSTKKFEATHETWLLLDNAMHRATQRPVKYLDTIEATQQSVSDKKPLSLLAASVAEQWEFASKKYTGQKDTLKNISEWIVRFYTALESVGENFRVMQQLQDNMMQLAEGKQKDILQKAADKIRKKPIKVEGSRITTSMTPQPIEDAREPTITKVKEVNLDEILGLPTSFPSTLEGLTNFSEKTDIQHTISSGKMSRLLLSTSSPDLELRLSATHSLQTLAHILSQPDQPYPEKDQLNLLFSEILSTLRHHNTTTTPQTPLPTVASTLASRLTTILADPTHNLYAKANRFLLRGPTWDMKRLIPHWTRDILFTEPSSDAPYAWTADLDWYLEWLNAGLATAADMELYRRSGVFEKILALYAKPNLNRTSRRLILGVVWRGMCSGAGASDTLITRVGIAAWIRGVKGWDGRENGFILDQLAREVESRCDTDAIERWRSDLPVLRQEVK